MIAFFKRRRQLAFAWANIERAISRRDALPFHKSCDKIFMHASKPTPFSNDASTALLMQIVCHLSIAVLQKDEEEGERGRNGGLVFIHDVLRRLIPEYEMTAPDRDRYERLVGDGMKQLYNAQLKKLEDVRRLAQGVDEGDDEDFNGDIPF